MNNVYNIRIGDMIYNTKSYNGDEAEDANVIGIVYKMTQKYVYYAICARTHGQPDGNHYITRDHKVSKERLYRAIRDDKVHVSYASGTKQRKRITEFNETGN